MQKALFSSIFLIISTLGFSQLPETITENSETKPAVEALHCRDARFRMVSECGNTVYYDEDQDAVFHKRAGKPYSGSCMTCFTNGNLEMYLTFVNGKPVGQDTIYYQNGGINLVRSHDAEGLGKEDGTWKFYRSDGSLKWEKNYVMGMADGEHRYYFPDSTLQKIEVWKNNELNGKKQEFYQDGTLKKEVDYKNGQWDGIYKTFFRDGKAESQQEYVNGKKEGLSTYFYENGNIFYTENHENGQLEGECERFYADGTKWTIETYKNGKRHGLFEEYYNNDKNVIKYRATYKKDQVVKESYFDEFGEEVAPPANPENGGGDEGGEE